MEEVPSAEIERLVLRLLGTRDHSRLELSRKLAARGFQPEEVQPVLDRLASRNILDEARLAEAYVAERMRKGFGPARIRRELKEKGLPASIVEPPIEAATDEWPECLAEAYRRRFGTSLPVERSELARRARFLEQRGFPPETIRRFLRWND